ncbi:hypothetical protein [Streptomyces sp. NBC_00212]
MVERPFQAVVGGGGHARRHLPQGRRREYYDETHLAIAGLVSDRTAMR